MNSEDMQDLHSKSSNSRRPMLTYVLITCFLLPLIFLNAYLFGVLVKMGYQYVGEQVGYIHDFSYISGTGSMYPTFPKGRGETTLEQIHETVGGVEARKYPGGIHLFGRTYFEYDLQHGDIVFFANNTTREIILKESSGSAGLTVGFVKRIIGLPGDTVELRNGNVYLNDEFLHEPYTSKPRSTFGGEFLKDCTILRVPEGSVFVMGDNRKESNDSRFELGLVPVESISHVIPVDQQENLMSHYRDTSQDEALGSLPVLDTQAYVTLLNERRIENNLPPLTLDERLSTSSSLRARVILDSNDTSFEATVSGYTMSQALSDAGYSNILWGEAPTIGYFDAQELIDSSFYFPRSREFLLNPEFDDIGISAVVGEINQCPTQVIVQHFGGYVPPTYSDAVIESWKSALEQLQTIYPGWIATRTYGAVYESNKEDIEKLITLLELRISRIEAILSRMERGQWLTQTEQQYISQDQELHDQQEALAKRINDSQSQ